MTRIAILGGGAAGMAAARTLLHAGAEALPAWRSGTRTAERLLAHTATPRVAFATARRGASAIAAGRN